MMVPTMKQSVHDKLRELSNEVDEVYSMLDKIDAKDDRAVRDARRLEVRAIRCRAGAWRSRGKMP